MNENANGFVHANETVTPSTRMDAAMSDNPASQPATDMDAERIQAITDYLGLTQSEYAELSEDVLTLGADV